MKRLELKKILLILIGVVTITSCQKENLLDEQKTLSTVKQQKFMEGILEEGVIPEEEYILYYIFEEGGFNVDNYASPIVFREHVEIDGVSYDIFITDDEAIMQNWKEEMLAQGKLVFVKFVNGVYIVVVKDIPDEEFIIMTEAERQYLLESGESMTIDEFQGFLEGFLTTMIQNYPIISNGHKMILVASVIEDNVLFTGVSTDGYKISWYERIHEHFEIVRHKPTFPLEPYQPSSPEDSLVKCIYTKDINEIMMWIYLELYFEKTFCVEFDEERGYWFGCDGLV